MATVPIVAQHDDFFVVDKPTGMHMHSQHQQTGIIPHLQQQLNCDSLWPVHRLDADTSGLLLIARNQKSAAELSQAFATRQTVKYYLALSSSKPQKKQGSIVGDMQSSRNGNYKLLKSKSNPAVTHFFSHSIQPGLRLFLLKPYSGKTHQLRVALKSIGAAILGDNRYGGEKADRLYLHAWHLAFTFQQQLFCYSQLPTTGLYFNDRFREAVTVMTPGNKHPWPDTKLQPLVMP
ncbi:MAG: TIGR01621 family pseudouridine synthase [Aestuariibacter sp.]